MKSPTPNEKSQTSWLRRVFGKTPDTDFISKEFAKPNVSASRKPARNRRVLIVDDDPVFLKATSQYLVTEGFDVMVAKDGCEAIEAIRTQPLHVLVLDINLPQDVSGVPWDGFRIISWLERTDSLRNIAIVIATVEDPMKRAKEAFKAGASGFFHKCSDHSHLLILIEKGLSRFRPSQIENPSDFDTSFRF